MVPTKEDEKKLEAKIQKARKDKFNMFSLISVV